MALLSAFGLLAANAAAIEMDDDSSAGPGQPQNSNAPRRNSLSRAAPQFPGGLRPIQAPICGPYAHKILSASSRDGLTWTRDEGFRLEHASVPCAVADGDRILLYYVDADRGPGRTESVGCAVSRDGIRFEKLPFVIEGLPTAKAIDPCVLKDAPGKFRLYYFGSNAGGDLAGQTGQHEIHLALSNDGIRFKEAGVAFRHPDLVDPDVFRFKGTWFMYVFGRGNTVIATSSDGKAFTYKQELGLPGFGTVAPVMLNEGRLRLYAFEQRQPTANAFVSFLSTDGINWTREAGERLRAGDSEQITDPFVFRWQGGWKMYFKSEQRAVLRSSEMVGPRPRNKPGPRPVAPPTPGGQGLPDRNRPGPWDNDVLVYRVRYGSVPEKLATFDRAGVPTVARLQDGRLIAAFQNFPADDNRNFDRVAVRCSSDEGRTWTQPEPIEVDGMEPGLARPFDPTLVPLPDGRVRIYFTSNRDRDFRRSTPAIYSAISTNGIHYNFEPGVRFAVEGRIVIDCAAALHNGVFHLIVPDNGSAQDFMEGPGPGQERPGGNSYHAVSRDGLKFKRVADVKLSSTRSRWLGNMQSDGSQLVFFGTGPGPWPVTSKDGLTWETDANPVRVPGADPGTVKLRDGSWLLVVTGPPRTGTPNSRNRRDGAPTEFGPLGPHG